MTGKGNTHYFIITDCIHKIFVTDDFDQLTVVEFGNQYFFKIRQDLTEISWEMAVYNGDGHAKQNILLSADPSRRF